MQTALITLACFLLAFLTAKAGPPEQESEGNDTPRFALIAQDPPSAKKPAANALPAEMAVGAPNPSVAKASGFTLHPATAGYAIAGAAFLASVILGRRLRIAHHGQRHA